MQSKASGFATGVAVALTLGAGSSSAKTEEVKVKRPLNGGSCIVPLTKRALDESVLINLSYTYKIKNNFISNCTEYTAKERKECVKRRYSGSCIKYEVRTKKYCNKYEKINFTELYTHEEEPVEVKESQKEILELIAHYCR